MMPIRADRSRQLFELAIVDEDPRLVIVRDQRIDVNLDGAGARHLRRVRDERTQTFTQGGRRSITGCSPVVRAVSCEDRASISFASAACAAAPRDFASYSAAGIPWPVLRRGARCVEWWW